MWPWTWLSSESQWNVDSNDILSVQKYCQLFMYKSNTFLCEKYVILPIQTNGAQMQKNSLNSPFPFGHVDPRLIHPSSTNPNHHPKWHPDPISRFATVHFPDRHTHRLTEWARQQVSKISAYAHYTDSQRHAQNAHTNACHINGHRSCLH